MWISRMIYVVTDRIHSFPSANRTMLTKLGNILMIFVGDERIAQFTLDKVTFWGLELPTELKAAIASDASDASNESATEGDPNG